MNINTKNLVSITDANQNFSKITNASWMRMVLLSY